MFDLCCLLCCAFCGSCSTAICELVWKNYPQRSLTSIHCKIKPGPNLLPLLLPCLLEFRPQSLFCFLFVAFNSCQRRPPSWRIALHASPAVRRPFIPRSIFFRWTCVRGCESGCSSGGSLQTGGLFVGAPWHTLFSVHVAHETKKKTENFKPTKAFTLQKSILLRKTQFWPLHSRVDHHCPKLPSALGIPVSKQGSKDRHAPLGWIGTLAHE